MIKDREKVKELLLRQARNVRRRIIRAYGRSFDQCYSSSRKIRELVKPHVDEVPTLCGGEFWGPTAWNKGWASYGPHYWVQWRDIIIDVTIDQFSEQTVTDKGKICFPAILFKEIKECKYIRHYRTCRGKKYYPKSA